jgi:hypothetical protein
MIDIERISPKAHRIVVMGAFQFSDAKRLVDFAKESTDAGDGGNVLFDLTALADFSFAAVSEELAHLPALLGWAYGLDRIAVLSDENWIRTAARLESALLPGVAFKVYAPDEADAAMAWVMEEAADAHSGAFRELDIGKPKIAAFELLGRLDKEQSEAAVELVRARLERPDCSRLMLVITNWHGFDAEVILSEKVLPAKLELMSEFDRCAILGGPHWIKAAAGFVGAFIPPEIRVFDLDNRVDALEWLGS